ncbi:MAG: DMT family transporter [Polyangiales bacterium]
MMYLGALSAFAASVTWAFASTRYSIVAREQGAVRVGVVRAVTASGLWLTWLACTDGLASLAQIDGRHALILIGSVMCSYVVGDRVFFAASARLGVPSALAIATIYPLWAALYGTFVRGESLGPRRIVGIACCLAGVSAVLWMSRDPKLHQARGVWQGAALALLTSCFWAGNAVFLKLGTDDLSIYQANGFRYTVAALVLLVQLRTAKPPASKLPMRELVRTMRAPLALDAGFGSVLFVYGIAHTDLALGATLSSLSPLVALPVAVAMRTERVTAGKVAAVCLTLSGVVLLVTTA